jgi:RNA polymerase sigma-70 factor (ECF subfamily)
MARGAADAVGRIDRAHDASRESLFASILATYEAPISRYLYGMVADAEVARDLAQETFLSAYRALSDVEVAALSAWLYRVATNHALMHLRRKRRIAWLPMSALSQGQQPPVAGENDTVVMADAVATMLARLDPKDRACLLLKAAGFSGEEIGAQLGCSPAAARTRLSRAREAFRRLYDLAEGE